VSRLAVAILLVLLCSQALSVIETYEFSSEFLEARYYQLSQELRCPKCQNQNIADSNAPIARDLRALLYRQLEAGASDDEILAFMVERYGEFVGYRPDVNPQTAVLWYFPVGAVGLGLLMLGLHLYRRRGATVSDAPTEAQLAGMREALDELSRGRKP
jgi:cytochrome c-type biogenesis protein CcmH